MRFGRGSGAWNRASTDASGVAYALEGGALREGATVARGNDVGDRVEGPEKARVGSPPAGRPRKTDASSVPAVNACKLS